MPLNGYKAIRVEVALSSDGQPLFLDHELWNQSLFYLNGGDPIPRTMRTSVTDQSGRRSQSATFWLPGPGKYSFTMPESESSSGVVAELNILGENLSFDVHVE